MERESPKNNEVCSYSGKLKGPVLPQAASPFSSLSHLLSRHTLKKRTNTMCEVGRGEKNKGRHSGSNLYLLKENELVGHK